MNLGKPVLDGIGATWDFSSPSIVIEGKPITLHNNYEPKNRGSIATIHHEEGNRNKIKLYSKRTIYLPPNSSNHILLKYQKHNENKLEDYVSITPDEQFITNKKLFAMPLVVARKDLFVTTITNFHDSGITIKKNQIVANASIPSNSTKELLAASPCTSEPSSTVGGSLSEEQCKNSNDDGNEDAHTPPSYHSSYSHNRIDAINDKHHSPADTKHHAVPNQEKEKYLTSKLHLDDNPLLQEGDRKEKLMNVLLRH